MESERRQATVMFADISGFTAMSERLDPEEVTDIINACFALLERAAQAHGGHVDKYIGDCIMVLFGVPTAVEHAPKRAVNAAIEMRNRLREFNRARNTPVPVGIHAGINTGLVVAGDVGGAVKREFTVVGDAVNLASRLKDAAPNGAIWVGPQTYRYTKDEFEYRALPPVALKGKEQPVPVYELLSVTERIHRPRVAAPDRRIYAELVGREHELERLVECVRTVARGQGGIVDVVGEAGMGKSRLLTEAVRHPAVGGTVTVLEARSLSTGQGLAFHPFVDLFRDWADIADDDNETVARTKLEAAVAELAVDGAEEILAFVGALMGVRATGPQADRLTGIEGDALEKLIQKSTRDLLRAIADRAPLALVFEDLHWADASSVSLLGHLLRLATEAPILFVHLLRPDYPQTSERIRRQAREQHRDRHVEIELRPLDARECDALVRNLLRVEDLPSSTRALIARKTEGNPFYIEEVIRSLIDEGAVEHREGRFHVTEKIDSVVIPGTIQEVIMARVDRLPESSRNLLQAAAVIGRTFPHRVVSAILRRDAAALEWDIHYLKRRQLVSERRQGGEVEYVFTHALTQETIYESILQKTRRELHLRVAEAIETLFADRLQDYYAMLALHFSRAENLENAEKYIFLAGDVAARSAASAEALAYFQEASRLYFLIHGDGGDPAKKALLEKNIGLALLTRGQLLDSIEHFERALALLGEHVPQGVRAVALRFARDLVVLLGRLYLARAAAVSRPNDREILDIRYNRARAQTATQPRRYFFDTIGSLRRLSETDAGQIEQACGMYAGAAALFAYSGASFAVGRRFLARAETLVRAGNVRDLFAYRSMRFIHRYLEGDWDAAHGIDEELIQQALSYGQLWDVNSYLDLECDRHIRQGAWAAARRDIDRMRELVEVYGYDFARSNLHARSAFLLVERRELPSALEALDLYAARDEELFQLLGLGPRAKVHILQGDCDTAVATLARAERIVRRLRLVPPYHLTGYLTNRFLLDLTALEACLAGDRAGWRVLARRARRSGRRAVRTAARVPVERTETYRLAGRLAWLLGRHDRALAWWARSIDAGRQLGARPELARTCMEVGQRLAGDPSRTLRGMDAPAYQEEARRLFVELELTQDLTRLDETLHAA
jgi:class 3 adenylate cyclase/tetratricopeptide (TPR) repeat protein